MTGRTRVTAPRQVMATAVIRRMTSGRNQPVLLEARAAGGSPFSCVAKLRPRLAMPPTEYLLEWLGAAIARRMGLTIPEPLAVTISPELASAADGAVSNELRGSTGVVFGSRYVEAITQMPEHRLPYEHRQVAALILAFDVFVHNPDRRAANKNLLVSKNEVVVYDHELAFGFLFAVGAGDPAPDHCADIVQNHALRALVRAFPPKPAEMRRAIALVSDEFLADLVAATPVEWTVGLARGKLEQIVEVLRRRRQAVDQWLPKVIACIEQ